MSKTVLFSIKSTPDNIVAYSPTYLLYQNISSEITLTTKFVICMYDDVTDKSTFLNLSLMMREANSVTACTTWEDISTSITDIDMLAYAVLTFCPSTMLTMIDGVATYIATPKHSNIQGGPNILSIEYNEDIRVDYGTIDDPTTRNNPNLKFMMPDIIYSQPNKTVVDFTNSIPLVNGLVAYPEPFNNELWVRDTTKYMYSTHDRSKNLLLVDFGKVGGMSTVRLNDCEYLTKEDSLNVVIRLPEDISMDGTYPILVLGRRMFFNKDYRIIDKRTISIDLNKINFDNILQANKLIEENYLYNTDIVRPKTPIEYIKTIFDKDNYENYVILVNNPYTRVCYTDIMWPITQKDFIFPPNVGGLLIKRTTRETIDYIMASCETKTRIYTDLPYEGNSIMTNSKDHKVNIAYTKTSFPKLISRHYEYLDIPFRVFDNCCKNFNDNDMTLLDIVTLETSDTDPTDILI